MDIQNRYAFYWRILTNKGVRLNIMVPVHGDTASWELNYWGSQIRTEVAAGTVCIEDIDTLVAETMPRYEKDILKRGEYQFMRWYSGEGVTSFVKISRKHSDGTINANTIRCSEDEAANLRQEFLETRCYA